MGRTASAEVIDPPVLCDGCGLLCLGSELRLRRDIEFGTARGPAGRACEIVVQGPAAAWISPSLMSASARRAPQGPCRPTDKLCFECYFLAERQFERALRAQRRSTIALTLVTLALSAVAVLAFAPRAYGVRGLGGPDAYKPYVKQPILTPSPYTPPFEASPG